MRNLFVKNYVAFALLILVSFTFAGGVFMAQVSRYSVKEKQEQLEAEKSIFGHAAHRSGLESHKRKAH